VETDFADQADMCEIVRALVANGKNIYTKTVKRQNSGNW